MSKKTRAKVRRALLSLSLVLVMMLVAVGGTIAWLQDSTTSITNTFTTTGIDIELKETKKSDGTVVDAGVTDWSAEIIPGATYDKNPIVSVVRPTTDVDVYLYVKVEESENNCLEYTSLLNSTKGWTELVEGSNIWWREVKAEDEDISWHLIDGDTVTIDSDLTKEAMPTADLTIKYTAYAIQSNELTDAYNAEAGINAKDGWVLLGQTVPAPATGN